MPNDGGRKLFFHEFAPGINTKPQQHRKLFTAPPPQ
jgi:hypothetical protein